MTSAVNFAGQRGASLGDNFRAAGANGLRGVNPGVSSPTKWGIGNLPATRVNSGGSALRGRAATGNFAVSLSNITSKPKFGLAIQ
jgi:hypothetical protein